MSGGRSKEQPLFGLDDFPELLPNDARDAWPDMNVWPTARAVQHFRKQTRRKREARIAVITGLRSISTANTAFMWSWLGLWFGLIAIGLSFAAQPMPVHLAIGALVVFGLVLAGVMSKLLKVAELQEARARRAGLWLRALTDDR